MEATNFITLQNAKPDTGEKLIRAFHKHSTCLHAIRAFLFSPKLSQLLKNTLKFLLIHVP
jgi:hypothetical protein